MALVLRHLNIQTYSLRLTACSARCVAGVSPKRHLSTGHDVEKAQDSSSTTGHHVSIIQGASRGLGLEFVRQLLSTSSEQAGGRSGGKVVATCRNPSSAHELSQLAREYPDRLSVLPLDVTDEDSVKAAAEACRAQFGQAHLLINVTGVLHTPEGLFPETALAKVDPKNLLYSYQVNAVGPLLVTKAFAPLLTSTATSSSNKPWNVVVANLSARVSSIGDNRLGGWHSYRASKSALNMLTKNVAIEFARKQHPVTCILLHPGTVSTELSLPFQKNVPAGKLFTKERAIRQLLGIIENVSPDKDNGVLFAWDGQRIPW